jgi:hypothetical protein
VLQEAVQDLQSQLQTIATLPQTTWALIAANGNGNKDFNYPPVSRPANARTISSFNTNLTDMLHCTVDISRAGSEGDRISAGAIRAAVEREIRAMDDYQN